MKITLPACQVPNGYSVTKPTGTVHYHIAHNLKVYSKGRNEIAYDLASHVFLYLGNKVEMIAKDTPVTVQFDTVQKAIDFLEKVQCGE